jgi:ATP-dependent DNA helicase RecG
LEPRALPTLDARIASMPWPLTDDQARALADIRAQLEQRGRPSNYLLTGECGSGKSAIACLLAVAYADLGKRTVLLAPNARLAAQLHLDFTTWFADRPAALVTGESELRTQYPEDVLIGTTALLHRPIDPPDLLIVDEQHRFGRSEREQLLGQRTDLLEMTATPIPRTQALLQFGNMSYSQMRQTHAPKTFHTRLYEGNDGMRELFAQIDPALRSGDPLLVVYPRREAGEGDSHEPGTLDRYAVDRAFARWDERYPGRVAFLTANEDDETKERVLAEFASGRVPILCATSIVELGLNIGTLHRIVIVCPERYGLVSLHQLRGRTARHGGEGYCELLCPEPISPVSRERLRTFMSTTDGFTLAELDLRARGAGDLGADSTRQSGAENSILFGVKLDAALLAEAVPVWERWQREQAT